jgi:hypothetical protein
MATVIGVGMQMTANASGMTKGLSDADRALQLLQKIVEQNQESLQKFSAEADKTSASIEKLADNTSILSTIEVGRVLVDVGKAIADTFVKIGSSIGSIAGPISSALDSLNDLSARTGVNVESLQAYSLAAKMAGVDTSSFAKAAQALTLNIGKATPGGELDKALKGINLSVTELRTLAPEQQFSAIGDAISQLPTAADRAAAAVAVFGKQGAALAPLFREGAASIEELRARAERLGVIVSETQINNVAKMNDAFDLVRATIEGIIGQVIGNLAPAVTAVTEQFLRFVEEWSGAQGKGGTGIANGITDVLLRGAEIFAGVFDDFLSGTAALFGDIGTLTNALAGTADVFNFAINALTAVSETFRYLFNIFEVVGNNITLGFAKWSQDLGDAGKELATQSEILLKKNQAEMEAAKQNAINATAAAFGGAPDTAKKAGDTAGVAFVSQLRERIQRERSPEVKIVANIDDTRKKLTAFLNEAGDGASDFFKQSVATLDTFEKQAKEGGLIAAQINIMNGFAEKLNTELDREVGLRRQAADAASAQAEADAKRVDDLLKQKDKSTQLESDLRAVIQAQAAAEEQLAASRANSSQQEANAAAARLAQLDQLRAKLEDDQAAIEQGFANGFTAAFTKTAEGIAGLIAKAGEFGNAGAQAAKSLQDGIAKAQEQARAGILTQDVYDREIANQRKVFEDRIAKLEELKKREQDNQNAVFQGKVEANNRVQQFLQQQLGEQGRAEAAVAQEVAARKLEAVANVRAIENQIALEKQAIEAARDQGDMRAAKAGVERLNQLNQVLAVEEKIANGQEQQIARQRKAAEERQKIAVQQQEAVAKQQEEAAKAQQKQQEAIAQEQARIAEENRKAAEAEFNRQQERIRQLNTLGERTIKTSDVRTAEGSALVLNLAASAQDPALIEARLQTKQLQLIAQGITQAAANYFKQPVAIVGYSSFGNVVP